MKTIVSLWTKVALAACLATPMVVPHVSQGRPDRVGNGGNFHELQFTALAYELKDALTKARRQEALVVPIDLALLARQLGNATVKSRSQTLVLRGEPKHAINYPDLVLVEFETNEWRTASLIRKYEMVMHELYPLVGTLDEGYHKAIAQVRQLNRLGLLAQKRVTAKVVPTLLYEAYDDQNREGLSHRDATEICSRYKEQAAHEYFGVYCVFIEKSWRQWEQSQSKSQAREHWVERTGKRPLEWREVLRTITQLHEHAGYATTATFGIRVYGLGQLSKLPWQVLLSSEDFGDELGSRPFATRSLARDACRSLTYKLDANSVRYYRAVCRTSLDTESGKYHYEIVTQNPLANAAMPEEK